MLIAIIEHLRQQLLANLPSPHPTSLKISINVAIIGIQEVK